MKTLHTLLSELESVHSYHKYGVMTLTGKLHHGDDHPSAETHGDLSTDLGIKSHHSVDWAQEYPHHPEEDTGNANSSWLSNLGGDPSDRPKLNLRTTGKQSLAAAIKHFELFPHVPGRSVDWEHTHTASIHSPQFGHFGSSVGVLNRMKAHYEKHYGKLED